MAIGKLPSLIISGLLAYAVTANSNGDTNVTIPNAVNLNAPDGSARATFVKTGATLTHFWVKDKHGQFRDIAIGFDNLTEYETAEGGGQYFGPVVGRYANRIRNGTFTIPISKDASGPGEKFEVPKNTNNGTDAVHGGFDGYNSRVWDVLTRSENSVTFTLLDPDGKEGFPGFVFNTATYTLDRDSSFKISLRAWATKETPIMLTGHHFWNLEAYQESEDLSSHFMQLDSSRFVATDGHLIPTGDLATVENTPLNFRKAKSIGGSINDTAASEYCGTGCVGFDNCWVYDNNIGKAPVLSIWSTKSGIKLDVTTDQQALQIYTCNGLDGTIPRKREQGGPGATYGQHSCLVIEQQSIIDAINNPEFGVDQIYGPNRTYEWEAVYKFSVLQ
ncbi:galactose mutarotase-like protein [Marasmius fiardii PR-910]|nr:galactose mutarotase-like protein [Marasmius fiardii PR-910]